MEVLAGEIMESAETSVIIENTRRLPDERIKDTTATPYVDVFTTSEEPETPTTPVSITRYGTEMSTPANEA